MLRPIATFALSLLALSLVPVGCSADDDDDDGGAGRPGAAGSAGQSQAGQGQAGQGQAGQGNGSTFDCEGQTCDASTSFCWTRSNRMGGGPLTLEANECLAYPAGCNDCNCAVESLSDERRASGCMCVTSNDALRVDCQRVIF